MACIHQLLALVGLFTSFTSCESVQITINPDKDNTAPTYYPKHLGGSRYSTRFEDTVWDNDKWTLTTTTVRPNDFRASAFTANGYFGHSMASIGPFSQIFAESSGWPLFNERQTFGTISGFFDRQAETEGKNYPWLSQYGWDSAISGTPHWGPLVLELEDGKFLSANTSVDQLSNVELTQDFKQGLAMWKYTWTPEDSDELSFDITYTAFADKLMINRGYVQLQIEPSKDCNVSIVNVLDGVDALRTVFVDSGIEGNTIYSAVSPEGVPNVTAWMYAGMTASGVDASAIFDVMDKDYISKNDSSIAQGVNATLKAGESTIITKFVGVASTDAFADPRSQAKIAAMHGVADGYDKCFEQHTNEWSKVLPRSSVADYADPNTGLLPSDPALIEKAVVGVVSIFGLLMNTVSENAAAMVEDRPVNVNGISVCGLTSDCYGGQRFWDQDVWMHPHLAASFPIEATQITNYRVGQYPQAKANAQTAYQSSKNDTTISENAAAYAWTSGRDGNCTATGPCFDYEYHLNGDIVQSFLVEWAASGDSEKFRQNFLGPMESIATLFSDVVEKNGSSYSLTNMTDPDEYANNVNNGGFTQPLIADVFNKTNWFREFFGLDRNTEWDDKGSNIFIPRVGELSLEYDTMNGSIEVKQADVVLKIYPLGVENYTVDAQLADLDYYAGKQSIEGPGMTYAIFSIAANDISPSGCSGYTYDLNSWSPYARAPWFSFSEQLIDEFEENGGTNPAYPFLTGHGGFLQVDLFGYLGLRYRPGFALNVNPTLPPQIAHLAYPTFYHLGWPVKAVTNATHTTLTRMGEPLASANSTFATADITVQVGRENASTYSLPPAGNLTLPNRPFQYNKTVPGNVLQCQPASSPDAFLLGQFPLAAVDGAISTLWEPAAANVSQRLTVDTRAVPFTRVAALQFDWADSPPANFTVVLHNGSCADSAPGRVEVRVDGVEVSEPYDVEAANRITPYRSNKTEVRIEEVVWSGSYATLIVEGNLNDPAENATGATVAEFAVVGME